MNKLFLSLTLLLAPAILPAAGPTPVPPPCCQGGKSPCCPGTCCTAADACCKAVPQRPCAKVCPPAEGNPAPTAK